MARLINRRHILILTDLRRPSRDFSPGGRRKAWHRQLQHPHRKNQIGFDHRACQSTNIHLSPNPFYLNLLEEIGSIVNAFDRSKSSPLPSMREGLPLSPPPSMREGLPLSLPLSM
jgi:hypothetical protein